MALIYIPTRRTINGMQSHKFDVVDGRSKKVRRTHGFYRSETALQEAIKRETRNDLEVEYRSQRDDFSAAEWDTFMDIMTRNGYGEVDRKPFLYDPGDDEQLRKGGS